MKNQSFVVDGKFGVHYPSPGNEILPNDYRFEQSTKSAGFYSFETICMTFPDPKIALQAERTTLYIENFDIFITYTSSENFIFPNPLA